MDTPEDSKDLFEIGYGGLLGIEQVQIGNYRVGRMIGQGTFGKVRLGINVKTNERVAIKCINKSSIANCEDSEFVYKEIFILTSLQHRNIIKLIEVLDTPSEIMLVMEYAGGGDLQTLVDKHGCLTEVQAFHYFQQIVAGLEYCHRARVVHLDLKLANILLSSEGEIKVADFGLSNSIRFGQKVETNCGTPAYAPPSNPVTKGTKRPHAQTRDVWALGVILYTMICGFLPFGGRDPSHTPQYIQTKINSTRPNYYFPDYVSEEAKQLIRKLLAYDPETRATIADVRSDTWMTNMQLDWDAKLDNKPRPTREQIQAAYIENENYKGSADRRHRNHAARGVGGAGAGAVGGVGGVGEVHGGNKEAIAQSRLDAVIFAARNEAAAANPNGPSSNAANGGIGGGVGGGGAGGVGGVGGGGGGTIGSSEGNVDRIGKSLAGSTSGSASIKTGQKVTPRLGGSSLGSSSSSSSTLGKSGLTSSVSSARVSSTSTRTPIKLKK